MMASLMRFVPILIAGLSVFVFVSATAEEELPAPDRAFESRLTEVSVYKSKPKDTLRSVSHFLYGHASWWPRLKQDNPPLQGVGPNDELRVGTPLRYRLPNVDDIYVVQPNDWLIRIVQWKYGATDQWEEIYRKNSERIANPNLIHPGDKLILETDGTVVQATSGEILVQGIPVPNPLVSDPGLDRAPSGLTMGTEEGNAFFFWGFVLGVLLLLLAPLAWWISQRRAMEVEKNLRGAGTPPRKRSKAPRKVAKSSPKPKIDHFRRRPTDELTVNKDLIHRDDGEIDSRPSYHTIAGPRRKSS